VVASRSALSNLRCGSDFSYIGRAGGRLGTHRPHAKGAEMALNLIGSRFNRWAGALPIAIAVALGAPTSAPAQGPTNGEYQQLYRLDEEARALGRLHQDASLRCDLAEMSRLQAELDDKVRLARMIAQTARTRSARRTANQFVEWIAAIANAARARNPSNCPEPTKQKTDTGGVGTGTTGTVGSTPPTESGALRVLRDMQADVRRLDDLHFHAAQRCDRAAMERYRRQLEDLAAQAHAVLRNSGLVGAESAEAKEAERLAREIEAYARHAASRKPRNCGKAGTQEPSSATGDNDTRQSSGLGEDTNQPPGTGQSGANTTGSPPRQAAVPTPVKQPEEVQVPPKVSADSVGAEAPQGSTGTSQAQPVEKQPSAEEPRRKRKRRDEK
jgi:hypothetical protein